MAVKVSVETEERVPQGELSAVELRALQGRPGPDRPELPFRHRAYICNIMSIDWPPVYFDYGQFAIKGCPEGVPYAVTQITARISPMDHGDKNKTTVEVGALHIAHDLVRMMNENSGMGAPDAPAFVGLFVCEQPTPTEEELQQAHAKLEAFARHYVQVADDDFENYHRPQFIPHLARRFARYLKLDKPWMVAKSAMIECPYCTENISAHAAICPNCKQVVNPERMQELQAKKAAAGAAPAAAIEPELVTEVATPQEMQRPAEENEVASPRKPRKK